MNIAWYSYSGWIAAAALLGFAISFIFAVILSHIAMHIAGVFTCIMQVLPHYLSTLELSANKN